MRVRVTFPDELVDHLAFGRAALLLRAQQIARGEVVVAEPLDDHRALRAFARPRPAKHKHRLRSEHRRHVRRDLLERARRVDAPNLRRQSRVWSSPQHAPSHAHAAVTVDRLPTQPSLSIGPATEAHYGHACRAVAAIGARSIATLGRCRALPFASNAAITGAVSDAYVTNLRSPIRTSRQTSDSPPTVYFALSGLQYAARSTVLPYTLAQAGRHRPGTAGCRCRTAHTMNSYY